MADVLERDNLTASERRTTTDSKTTPWNEAQDIIKQCGESAIESSLTNQ